MPRTIAFASPKGGCGATFVCAGIWQLLSQKNKRVTAVDMCFESCSLDYVLSFQNDYIYTLSDVLDASVSLDEALCGKDAAFIRCDYEAEDFDFDKAFSAVKSINCDFLLIDFDCSDRTSLQKVLHYADDIVFVSDLSPASIRHAERICAMCGFENTHLVINKIIPYLVRDKVHLTVDEALEAVGYPLLGLIPWDYAAEQIITNGIATATQFPNLCSCFDNMTQRLLGTDVPANDIEEFFRDSRLHKYLTKGRK